MTENRRNPTILLRDCCLLMSKQFLRSAQSYERRGDGETAERLRREALTQLDAYRRLVRRERGPLDR